jgi:glycine cleavage system transcriptional repressor
MKDYLVISGSGPDRVGIVDDISAFLSKQQINIEDSKMAVLGGEFALVLLVSGGQKEIAWLDQNLSELKDRTGLNLTARATVAPGTRQLAPALPYRLVVSGMDHPGIVRQFTNILQANKVNIESMETRVAPAPLSGTPVFTMECRLAVPAQLKISALRNELGQAAEAGNLDFDFETA